MGALEALLGITIAFAQNRTTKKDISHVVSIFNPEIPDVESSQRDLEDIEFPISFRICIHHLEAPIIKNQKFKDAGYKNYYAFFKGRSLYNKSHYGFLGHLENGSTKFASFEGNFKSNY